MTTDPFDDLFEGYDGPEASPATTQAVYRSMQPGLQQSRAAHRRRVAGGWILATALLAGSPIAIGYVTDSTPTEVDVSDSSVSTPDDDAEPVEVDDSDRPEDSDDDPTEDLVESVDDEAGDQGDAGDQAPDGDDDSRPDDGDSAEVEADPDDDADGGEGPGDSSDDPDEADDDEPEDVEDDDEPDEDEPETDEDDEPDTDDDEPDGDDEPIEIGASLPVTTSAGSVTAVVLADGTIDLVDVAPAPGYTTEIELRGDEARITFSHETEDDVEVEFEIENGELVADIDDDSD